MWRSPLLNRSSPIVGWFIVTVGYGDLL